MGCATSGDVRGWVALVAQREDAGLSKADAYAAAWRKITDVNPFPSVMGRICPHPCEDHCNRSGVDEPLAINAMERFLGDWALEAALPLDGVQPDTRPGSVGVIGAGPSGLSFAYQLARRGYPVVVYEGREKPGGMLRYGIPDYRLPPSVLDAEIQRILDLGVELRLNTLLGRDVTLDELKARHQALYLGIGAQRGRGLGIPGEEGPGVWTGTDFLRAVNDGESVDIGSNVAVIGGGNTAIDAARTARRSGANVWLVYRRSRAEMPAIRHEIDEAIEEGVELVLLAAPVSLEREGARPDRLVVQRMELGEPDASGRRRPVPIAGSEFKLPVDSVIAAVSQRPDLRGLEAVAGDGSWLVPDDTGLVGDGIWAGGDALGAGIAGFAIAQGRRAAEALHARLSGLPASGFWADGRKLATLDVVNPDFHERRPAAKPRKLAPVQRLSGQDIEVSAGISEAEFLAEAQRCFSCGSCFGCRQCAMYCTVGSFVSLDQVGPGMYYALSLDHCEKCGKCIEVCPCGYLGVSEG